MTKYEVYAYVSGLQLGINDCAYYCKEERVFKTLKAAKEWAQQFRNDNIGSMCDIDRVTPTGRKRVA